MRWPRVSGDFGETYRTVKKRKTETNADGDVVEAGK